MNRVVRDRGNDAERSERVTCDEVSGRISSYIDGELSRCVSEKVSGHIRSCERCRREYEELVGIDVALRGITAPGAARGLCPKRCGGGSIDACRDDKTGGCRADAVITAGVPGGVLRPAGTRCFSRYRGTG